jgi:hypothetical protein
MPAAGHANSRGAVPHGGDGRPSFARLKGDHGLAGAGGRLPGTLGEEIEAQDHDPACHHGVDPALRSSGPGTNRGLLDEASIIVR